MTIPELLVADGRWPTPNGPKGYVPRTRMTERSGGWRKYESSVWVSGSLAGVTITPRGSIVGVSFCVSVTAKGA